VKYRDLFKLWKEIGMKTIFLGIEKVDDNGLDSVRKRTKGGAATNSRPSRFCGTRGLPDDLAHHRPAWGKRTSIDWRNSSSWPTSVPDVHGPDATSRTELWETSKAQLTTDDYNLFDVMHLVLPSKLPPSGSSSGWPALLLMDQTTRLTWKGALNLTRLVLRGKSFAVRRVLSASREMRNAKAYLQYPGSTPRPDFVPGGFGKVSWVERSRSYLTQRRWWPPDKGER